MIIPDGENSLPPKDRNPARSQRILQAGFWLAKWSSEWGEAASVDIVCEKRWIHICEQFVGDILRPNFTRVRVGVLGERGKGEQRDLVLEVVAEAGAGAVDGIGGPRVVVEADRRHPRAEHSCVEKNTVSLKWDFVMSRWTKVVMLPALAAGYMVMDGGRDTVCLSSFGQPQSCCA